MDRFADRRFEARGAPLTDSGPVGGLFLQRNNILFSPLFSKISPSVIRWVADRHGRVLAVDRGLDSGGAGFAADPAGLNWRGLLDREDRRIILQAAAQNPSEPVIVRLQMADGASRWHRFRMVWNVDANGHRAYYGTAEDVHDNHERSMREAAALAESRDHYRWSVELSPQVPWTAMPDGSVDDFGPRWSDMTGLTRQETLGGGWITALHREDIPRVKAIWDVHLVNGMPVDIEYRIRLRDGKYRWMRARASARRCEQGSIIRWYGTLEDVHAQKLAQSAMTESEERFRLAVESARLGIWDFDTVTGMRTWSSGLRQMLGIDEDEPATTELALALVHPDDRSQLSAIMNMAVSGPVQPHFEATLRIHRATDGAMRWIRSTGWITRSRSGRPLRIVVTFLDVTDARNAEERIRWVATHDPMTSLPNRTLWQATLDDMAARAQQTGERFALLMLDIDDLKRTNDSLGHDAGDALISVFAKRLAEVAPPDAVLGRLGGDEFGLLTASLTSSAALDAFSTALIERVRAPHVHNGHSLECGVSMGGAVFGEHGARADDLLKAADLALYASKSAGRGRLTLFHSALRAEAQQRSSMLRMAQQVVSEDLIRPYYQPKVDMRSGVVLGYEALLRWDHPRVGVQLPGTIAAAFNHGELAVGLTRRMLAAVLRDLQHVLRDGIDPGRVAINASAADFANGDFAERVLEQLADYGVPTAHFEIEVTETVFLGRGADQVDRALRHFADAGVRVALDDFGTGFASLSHLKQYPVDILKIDRSFVSNIDQNAGDAAIVDAIVKLGGSFGMEVVAEGVETAVQVERLLGHGCVIGQGFFLGYPQPFAADGISGSR